MHPAPNHKTRRDHLTALAEQPSPVERGIAALRAYLGDDGAALLQQVLPKAGEAAVFRLTLPVDYVGLERSLRIAFPTSFPRATLSLRVEPSPWLVWPHAMKTGLCLHGFKQKPVTGSPEVVVEDSLARFRKIVSMSLPTASAAVRKDEFQREVISYWKHQQPVSAQSVCLLQRPARSGSLVAVTIPRMRSYDEIEPVWVADSASDIAIHIRRTTGRRVKVRSPARAAFYLKLRSFPSTEVPSSESWLEWLKPHASLHDFANLLFWFGESSSLSSRWVALELPGGGNAPLYCLNLRDQSLQKDRGIRLGVRSGRRWPEPARRAGFTIASATINVLDRSEVLSRDMRANGPRLSEARVVIVGQGSLGSPVALHLARTGVGHLTVIDPDELSSANLGRHVLGTDDLGRNKAIAMRDRLQRDIPIAQVVAVPMHVELAVLTHPEMFERADVVIVTSADWASEVLLWRMKSEGPKWSLIQSWSEPHALVGHALLATAGESDARHLFKSDGNFKHELTVWPNGGSVPLPACGQSFIPGGGIGMATVATMTAQLAISSLELPRDERVWVSCVSNPQLAPDLGGSYEGPDLPENATGMTFTRAWPEAAAGD